jgi:galactokinase
MVEIKIHILPHHRDAEAQRGRNLFYSSFIPHPPSFLIRVHLCSSVLWHFQGREMTEELFEKVTTAFTEKFGGQPDFIARAPGRINLIGEHTDYNGGFVLPAAIDRAVLLAVRAKPDTREVRLVSLDYASSTAFNLDAISFNPAKELAWVNYIQGVAQALAQKNLLNPSAIGGAEIVITGNVPRGSGLSSSAAIEVASGLMFAKLAGIELDRVQLALACQWAENEFIGVKSGIMDQYISALGQDSAALFIDTRSLKYEVVPLGLEELGYKVVAIDSAVPRTLGSTAYNQRRAECEAAATKLANWLDLPENSQLRDISLEGFARFAYQLPEVERQRAHHVITENNRVLEMVRIMHEGLATGDNLAQFGQIIKASHASLRDDYAVSCKELDLLVNLAQACDGVIGARMVGAGFGGCTLNIVQADKLAEFEQNVVEEYRRQTKLNADWYVCKAVQGGNIIQPDLI